MKETISMMVVVLLLTGAYAWSEETIRELPAPQKSGGMPLMEALNKRHSTRDFDTERGLSEQTLSDMLWAAFGVNRPESGKRTAPSSYNFQDITIYVFTEKGTWFYEADSHRLVQVSDKDQRKAAGMQEYVWSAPLSLVYVSDYAKITRPGMTFDEKYKQMTSAFDAGHISQNVYLFCASAGLGAVARASVDQEAMTQAVGLRPEQHAVLGQTVGYMRSDEE
jgi:SagB-type dehydrogenase family enzyme